MPRTTHGRQWSFEILEDRCLLAADFGDAPDTALGVGAGNYQTLLSDNGPSHMVVAGLRMGASVDGDSGMLQNSSANADDVNSGLPIDEDGLSNPLADLAITIGAHPTVTARVTNTTGNAATIYGWIDYNADGVFDSATERASVDVPSGSNNVAKTLTFPTVPSGFTGNTFARFRLSTDVVAASPIGAAADGEVEDYRATIGATSSGKIDDLTSQAIGSNLGGGPSIADHDQFGGAVVALGDIDGDSIPDLAVGDAYDDTGGQWRGAIYLLHMKSDGTVRTNQKIAGNDVAGAGLGDYARFGSSIASLGDLDADGVNDIAVGAAGNYGAVYVLFLNTDGTVKHAQKIASGVGGGPTMATADLFGCAIAAMGDMDGDGITDIVVGASYDDTTGNVYSNFGAVYTLFLNPNGTVKSYQKIARGPGGVGIAYFNSNFGQSVASIGDLDGDGITDMVVGSPETYTSFGSSGSAYVLLMNANGTPKSSQQITSSWNGGPLLQDDDRFGWSVASLGDLDGDGITDIAVGALDDDTGGSLGSDRGAIYVLFLNANGTVKRSEKIASVIAEPDWPDNFGRSIALVGDLDADGVPELAVGAFEKSHRYERGIVQTLFLNYPNSFAPQFTTSATVSVPENTTAVFTVAATDADIPAQPVTFSIVGGADRTRFAISAGGVLTFAAPRDFEAPVDVDRNNVYLVTIESNDGHGGATTQSISVNVTDVVDAPSIDFGDAPDSGVGTGSGNYNTLATDNGPRHAIVAGLRIGAFVDGDAGISQNAAANADELGNGLPPDEDGIADPTADLRLTTGTHPTVNVFVTNSTGEAAILYGWIDYNADGTFDSATERASTVVPNNTHDGVVTLVFPTVPSASTGTTYARFRLSTDAAASQPTGAAADGEVEDYRVAIFAPATGRVDDSKSVRISSDSNGGPTLIDGERFGRAVVPVGDLNGDGVVDLAVGADQYDSDYGQGGAVYVLFMNADGTVKSSSKVASEIGGGPSLERNETFGTALAALGDLDGDGISEIAVGDSTDGFNGQLRGAVYVLFLNADGTVKHSQRIASGVGGGPDLYNYDQMGHGVAAIGDLDGDGIPEIAVGTPGDDTDDGQTGAVYVMFMNEDGTAKSVQKIAHETGGGPSLSEDAEFGTSVAGLGDFDGDGVNDIVVGAQGDDGHGTYRGMAYVVLLNRDGTAKSTKRIAPDEGGGPPLDEYDGFGSSVASLGDLDGDGVTDIAVGSSHDRTGGDDRGAIYVLMLNRDGTVKHHWKIANDTNGGPTLDNYDRFGRTIASIGDLDGDGIGELAVGATGGTYDDQGTSFGSVHILFLSPVTPDYGDAPDSAVGNGPANYSTSASDNGPSHIIVDRLRLGASVDSDSGHAQNNLANADNASGLSPSDEDGLVNPVADLQITTGTSPTVSLWATNTTGTNATLYGWIDYNGDGVFDNATERSSIEVPNGTASGIVTLFFPVAPSFHTGTTYARFRLSTDAAAAKSIGSAADGEVEDYRAQITAPSLGIADSSKSIKITRGANGVPNSINGFGDSVTAIGDLDGDGITDVIVGTNNGLCTLFMNANGSVKKSQLISEYLYANNLPTVIGDLDGDGIPELAAVYSWGNIHLIRLKADGTLKSESFIAGGLTVNSLAGIGDVDGDGVSDLAVGINGEDDGDGYTGGAVLVLLLNPDGSTKAGQVIASGVGGGPALSEGDYFGSAITSLGDIDGDGVSDMAVAAIGDKTGVHDDDYRKGAVYVLLMNPDGTAKSTHKIADNAGGGPALADDTNFGVSIASLGDLNGDGIADIAVGANYDDTGGSAHGAVHVFFLNADGTVKNKSLIADNTGGGPTLNAYDCFGGSITSLGDLNGDGVIDIAVGASGDDTAGNGYGAVYVLFLQPAPLPGDYNQSMIVDASDYVLWRKTLGNNVPQSSGADGDGDGIVQPADYDLWRANFGNMVSSGEGASAVADHTAVSGEQLSIEMSLSASGQAITGQPRSRDSHTSSGITVGETIDWRAIKDQTHVRQPSLKVRKTSAGAQNDNRSDTAILAWLESSSGSQHRVGSNELGTRGEPALADSEQYMTLELLEATFASLAV